MMTPSNNNLNVGSFSELPEYVVNQAIEEIRQTAKDNETSAFPKKVTINAYQRESREARRRPMQEQDF